MIKIFIIFAMGIVGISYPMKADVLTASPILYSVHNLNISTMENEIWKDIPDYEGYYQASSLGRIRSVNRVIERKDGNTQTNRGRILKTSVALGGYLCVKLTKDCIGKTQRVHVLVFEAFNKDKDRKGYDIDHIDSNRQNNSVENLQLLTRRENISKGVLTREKSSKYVGVRYKRGKWETQIRIGDKRKYIGRFDNEYDAYLAYQKELSDIKQ